MSRRVAVYKPAREMSGRRGRGRARGRGRGADQQDQQQPSVGAPRQPQLAQVGPISGFTIGRLGYGARLAKFLNINYGFCVGKIECVLQRSTHYWCGAPPFENPGSANNK